MDYLVGFEFDLQRHAVALDLTENIADQAGIEAGNKTVYVTSEDSWASFTYTTTEPEDHLIATITVSEDTTEGTLDVSKITAIVLADSAGQTVKLPDDITVAVSGMAATTSIVIGDATVKTGAAFTSKNGVITTTESEGSISVSVAQDESATINGVAFTAPDDGPVTADVTKASVVTNLSAKGTVKSTTGTVATKDGKTGLYTINGTKYTITQKAESDEAVTFTPSTEEDGGATSVTGLTTGATIGFTVTEKNKSISVNGSKLELTKDDNASIAGADGEAYLITGTANLSSATDYSSVNVATDGDAGTASTIKAVANGTTPSAIAVKAQTTKYTISSLEDGEKVDIDNTVYTYTAASKTLKTEGKTYILKTDGTVDFTIADGPDTVVASTAIEAVGDGTIAGTGELGKVVAALNKDETVYFDKNGNQLFDNTGAVYSLGASDSDSDDDVDTYTLTAVTTSDTAISIDASKVTGLVLDLDGDTDSTGVATITIDGETVIADTSTLGAGDTIKDGDTVLAVAKTAGAVLGVEAEKVTLTSGTYSTIGDNVKLSVEEDKSVTLDGVFTFAGQTGAGSASTATYSSTDKKLSDVVGDGTKVPTITAIDTGLTIVGKTSNDTVISKSENATLTVDNSGDITLTTGTFEVTKTNDNGVAVAALGNIKVTKGAVTVVADGTNAGKITGLTAGDEFTVADDSALTGNPLVVKVSDQGAVTINGVPYTVTTTLDAASITMQASAVDKIDGLTAATGVDWTGATATQYFDLTGNAGSYTTKGSERIVDETALATGTKYLKVVYNSTTGYAVSVVDGSTPDKDADYATAFILDAAGLASGKIVLDSTTSTNAGVKAYVTGVNASVTVAGVTADDKVNTVEFTGISDGAPYTVTGAGTAGAETAPTTITQIVTTPVTDTGAGKTIKAIDGAEYTVTYSGEIPALTFTIGEAGGGASAVTGLAAGVKFAVPTGQTENIVVNGVSGMPLNTTDNTGWTVIGTGEADGWAIYSTGTEAAVIATSGSSTELNYSADGKEIKTISIAKIDSSGEDASASIAVDNGALATSNPITALTANGAISDVGTAAVATGGAAGSYSVNGIAFSTEDTGSLTLTETTSGVLTVASLTSGLTAVSSGSGFSVNSVVLKSVGEGVKIDNTGVATLSASGQTVSVDNAGTAGDLITLNNAGEKGYVTVTKTGTVAVVSDISAGTSFSLGDASYTVSNTTYNLDGSYVYTLTKKDSSGTTLYTANAAKLASATIKDVVGTTKEDPTETGFTLYNGGVAGAIELSATAPFTGTDVSTTPPTDMSKVTKVYFDATGIKTATEPSNGAAAVVTRTSATATDNYTLSVKQTIITGVSITGVQAKVEDAGTGTVYTATGTSQVFTADGSFTMNGSDVFTAVNGTITATAAEDAFQTTAGTATAAYDITNGTSVTFQSGSAVSGAKVTTGVGTVTIAESTNTNDTVVVKDGTITGIDGDATITGAVAGQKITTTGDGKTTINGKAYTLSGDGSGITYVADTTGIKSFNMDEMVNGAKLTTTDSMQNVTLTGTNTAEDAVVTFSGIQSSDGVVIEKTAAGAAPSPWTRRENPSLSMSEASPRPIRWMAPLAASP